MTPTGTVALRDRIGSRFPALDIDQIPEFAWRCGDWENQVDSTPMQRANLYSYLLVCEICVVAVVFVIGVFDLRAQHSYLVLAIIASATTGVLAAAWEYFVKRLRLRHIERSKHEIQELQRKVEGQIGRLSDQDLALVPLVVSTSPAQMSSERYRYAITELRTQLAEVMNRLEKQRNEIVEVHKIDPVLQATLKANIESLTERIEMLEKSHLERWDVTLVLFQLLGAIGVILGVVLGIAKYFVGR
jgi:hypothetical protein